MSGYHIAIYFVFAVMDNRDCNGETVLIICSKKSAVASLLVFPLHSKNKCIVLSKVNLSFRAASTCLFKFIELKSSRQPGHKLYLN